MTLPQNGLIVLAVGGNSLITDPKQITVEDQFQACYETSRHISQLIKQGYRVVVTHGNGPQVGFILRRAELAANELHMVPLDSCGADTQGAIGYHFQRALHNCMQDWEQKLPVATVVTQVLVDANDPAFQHPTKPIGSFMNEATAEERRAQANWNIVEDAGRGFRRVVASPRPQEILEIDSIRLLLENNVVVIAVGGGGIPVTKNQNGELIGAEAVIDKDLASSLLAQKLNADVLLVSTAVEKVYLDFGKATQKALDRISVAEAKEYIKAGHFAPGSMLPKVQATLEFVEAGGKAALITDPANMMQAVQGKTGTWIVA